MDLRNVGLHRAHRARADMQITGLERYSTNDASQRQHLQRAHNACTVATSSPIQFPSFANGRSVIWICILSTSKRKDSAGLPIFIGSGALD